MFRGSLAPHLAKYGSDEGWVANTTSVTEIIGVDTPVIPPISAGMSVIPTTDGTSNLGTRP
ncbi:MAG TPA: hypothetical protein VGG18_06270 [Granulicella sp.]